MIAKLKKYLVLALGKTAPICAMILDLRIKMDYIRENTTFIKKEIRPNFDPALILSEFRIEAKHFDCSPARCNPQSHQPLAAQNKQTSVVSKPFCRGVGQPALDDLKSEIQAYFKARLEGSHIQVLNYWRSNELISPSMAAMAKCFLAIPSTSAPSKQVFLQCKTVFGPQRASLSPQSIEHLLCLKEW
jgi:hypothetical protein